MLQSLFVSLCNIALDDITVLHHLEPIFGDLAGCQVGFDFFLLFLLQIFLLVLQFINGGSPLSVNDGTLSLDNRVFKLQILLLDLLCLLNFDLFDLVDLLVVAVDGKGLDLLSKRKILNGCLDFLSACLWIQCKVLSSQHSTNLYYCTSLEPSELINISLELWP